MPIQLKYDAAHEVLVVDADGEISLPEIQAAGMSIINSEEYPPDVDTIWDLRKLNARHINRDFMESLVSMRQKQFQIRQGALLALVADSDLTFGLSRMYEMLSSELHQATHVFKSIDEALAWLIDARG